MYILEIVMFSIFLLKYIPQWRLFFSVNRHLYMDINSIFITHKYPFLILSLSIYFVCILENNGCVYLCFIRDVATFWTVFSKNRIFSIFERWIIKLNWKCCCMVVVLLLSLVNVLYKVRVELKTVFYQLPCIFLSLVCEICNNVRFFVGHVLISLDIP